MINPEKTTTQTKDYIIDGTTCVNDVLFASLYASMDREVISHLETYGAKQDSIVDLPDQRVHDGLTDLSEVSSSDDDHDDMDIGQNNSIPPTSHTAPTNINSDEFAHFFGNEAPFTIDGDSSDEAEGSRTQRELKATQSSASCYSQEYINQLLAKLKPSNTTEVPTALVNLGVVLSEVEGLVTVETLSSEPPGKVFDFGTVCCLESREIVGIIVDIMGPTVMPFYVIKRLSSKEIYGGGAIKSDQDDNAAVIDVDVDQAGQTVCLVDPEPALAADEMVDQVDKTNTDLETLLPGTVIFADTSIQMQQVDYSNAQDSSDE